MTSEDKIKLMKTQWIQAPLSQRAMTLDFTSSVNGVLNTPQQRNVSLLRSVGPPRVRILWRLGSSSLHHALA